MSSQLKLSISLNGADNISPTIQKAIARLKEFEAKIPNAAKKLKDLELNNKLIRDFNASRNAIKEMHPQLDKAREKLKELQSKVKIGQATTAQFLQARSAAEKLENKYSKLTKTSAQMSGALKAAGADLRNLTQFQNQNNVAVDNAIKANNRLMAQARLDRMKDSRVSRAQEKVKPYEQYGQSATRVGMTSLAAGYGVMRAGGSVMGAFSQSENASIGLKTAMMGVNGEAKTGFKEINELAESLGDKLPGTTADFKDMMTMLIRQGMTAKTILGGTGEAAAYLGVQLKMPVAQAAEFAAKMQDAVGASEKEMMGVMDIIQKTFYTGVDPSNMLEAFGAAKVGMNILKTSGEAGARVFAPLIAMLDQSGQSGGAAGNAISKVFRLGVLNNQKAKSFGLDFLNKNGEHIGIEGLFAQLEKLKNIGSTQKQLQAIKAIFGDNKEVGETLTALMNKGLSGYKEMQDKINQQAELKKRVDESLQTLSNLQEAAAGTFTNALAEMGSVLAPEIKMIINKLGEWSATLRKLVADNPVMAKVIFGLAAVMGGLLIVIGAVLTVIGFLTPVFVMLTIKAAILGTTVLAMCSPFLLIVGAVIAVIAIFVLLYANWNDMVMGAKMLWQDFSGFIINLWNGISASALAIWNDMVMGAKILWQGFSGFFINLWNGISAGAIAIWNNFSTFLSGKITEITNYFTNTPWSQIGLDIVKGIGNGILAGFDFVYKPISDLATGAVAKMKSVLGIQSPSTVFAGLGNFTAMGMGQGILAGIPNVVSSVQELSSRVTQAGAMALTAGALAVTPTFASATALTPSVLSAPSAYSASGNSNNGQNPPVQNIVININGANQSPQEIAKEVARQLNAINATKQTAQNARFYDSE